MIVEYCTQSLKVWFFDLKSHDNPGKLSSQFENCWAQETKFKVRLDSESSHKNSTDDQWYVESKHRVLLKVVNVTPTSHDVSDGEERNESIVTGSDGGGGWPGALPTNKARQNE